MYMDILPASMYVYHEYAWCSRMSKEVVKSPGAGITGVCEHQVL